MTAAIAEPGIGHNRAPFDIEGLPAQLKAEHAPLGKRTDELLAMIANSSPAIVDDAMEGRATDFAAQIAAHIKLTEDAFEVEKRPFLTAGRIVDAFFKNMKDPLVEGRKAVMAKLTAYKEKKLDAERKARLEAERIAREAAEKAAAEAKTEADLAKAVELEVAAVKAAEAASAPAAELTRSRGTFGGSSGLRTTAEYEIVDLEQIPRTYLTVNDAAIKAAIKGSPKDQEGLPILKVPGVRIYLKRSATGR